MEYRVSFLRSIAKQGEIARIGGNSQRSELRFGYGLDTDNLLRIGGSNLDVTASDFIEIMFAVTKADRLCPRGPGPLSPRSIEVLIPVRRPDLWNAKSVQESLCSLLAWISGDQWELRFFSRADGPLWAESQRGFWLANQQESDVLLNSGGLDSLIGLAQWAARHNQHRLLSITTGAPKLIRLASDIANQTRQAFVFKPRIDELGIEEGIYWPPRSRDQRESSWRTKALFPMAAGAAAAHLVGASSLLVFENGIGAIALPMTPDHAGIGATRSMHPRTLNLFSKLASQVFEHPFNIVNNGLLMTKRQGVAAFLPTALKWAVQATHSCPRWSYLNRPCGNCTSCVLRHMALRATVFEESTSLLDPHSLDFQAMAYQVAWLRSDLSKGAVDFVQDHPHLYDAVRFTEGLGIAGMDLVPMLANLYREHIVEFDACNSDLRNIQPSIAVKPPHLHRLPA